MQQIILANYSSNMQESFEFNAPKSFNFIAKPKYRHPTDISIDLNDPNDYWFMVTHVQISPIGQLNEDSQENRERKPLVRKLVIQQLTATQIEQSKQGLLDAGKIKKKKTARKISPSKKAIAKATNIAQQKNIKMKNDLPNDGGMEKNMMHQKMNRPRNKSEVFMPKQINGQSKQKCHFPISQRLQGQWGKRQRKAWYSCSPQSKTQYQKKMGQIKLTKPLKSVVPHMKEKKIKQQFKF